jgi:hypothetical protein
MTKRDICLILKIIKKFQNEYQSFQDKSSGLIDQLYRSSDLLSKSEVEKT